MASIQENVKHDSYAEYLVSKINSQREHIEWQRSQLRFGRLVVWELSASVVGLLGIIGFCLYQLWLVG